VSEVAQRTCPTRECTRGRTRLGTQARQPAYDASAITVLEGWRQSASAEHVYRFHRRA